MTGERALADTDGKFAQVVRDGRKVTDLEWRSGRIVLSNKRLVLASNDGKRTLVLEQVTSVKNRKNATRSVSPVSGYFSVQVGSDAYLVAPSDLDAFEEGLYSALLDGEAVLIKHPAVRGGVVRESDWQQARVDVDADSVGFGVATGQFVEVELADVGAAEVNAKTVTGDDRRVVEIEHTADDGAAVETHVSGAARHVAILESLVKRGELQNSADVDLSQTETEVLMALYSGVSPFEIPEFVGIDGEEVEAVFDRLVEAGLLTEKRVRRDVKLKARGRNIASDVIADQ